MLRKKPWRILSWAAGIALLFGFYTFGLSRNPPGFYVDECGLAYNAYLVSRTGAGEFGSRFPLYFKFYTDGFTQYASPTQIYLLAAVFRVLPPSILLARLFSAFWVFAACLLLGLLAKRISGKYSIAIIVAGTALLTPWFFDVRGLLLEPHFVPMALVLFLLVLYSVQRKDRWTWLDAATLAGTLGLLTYCYTSGRLLGSLLAVGLLLFATTRLRFFSIMKTWLLYGLALLPILVFNLRNPGVLTQRLYEISYIRPGVAWSVIASQFARRYLEDQSLTGLLLTGDYHPRHHVQGSGGAILFATFGLAVFGLLIIVSRRLRDPWWRFVAYGVVVSIVPGAITNEPFHQMRLMAYPVFLVLLTVPAIEWLTDRDARNSGAVERKRLERASVGAHGLSRQVRLGILSVLLILTIAQAIQFQVIFRRDGPRREFDFDVPYKAAFDAAVAQPIRPIYLEDGFWGPAYMHGFWYATVDRRPTSEFVHLEPGVKPPSGAVVISSEQNCQSCTILKHSGVYLLYKAN